MSNEFKDLHYTLLPLKPPKSAAAIDCENTIFKFWKRHWSQTLKKLNLPPLNIDEFLRQDFACSIQKGSRIVASHLYSIYDVNALSTFESSYFCEVQDEVRSYCKKNKVYRIISQEYLVVAPEMRKSHSSMSIPELLIGLASKLMKHSFCQTTVGTVRVGAPSVERICNEINAQLLEQQIERYNMPHKFFIAQESTICLPGNLQTRKAIEFLWESKTIVENQEQRQNLDQQQPLTA